MIPDELMARRQWVVWRFEERAGRQTKTPVDAHNGRHAKTNDPATWSTFAEASSAVSRLGCDGVGFVFAADDPYVGIDLDHCRDAESGAICPSAQRIIDLLATYTEVSISGSGIHMIVRAQLPPGSRHRGQIEGLDVEIYERGRYFVMSGEALLR